MKQKYISDREKVKKAIIEIVKNKKSKGVEPAFATVRDIVSHTDNWSWGYIIADAKWKDYKE